MSYFDDDAEGCDPPHPLGVLPAGNYLLDAFKPGFIDARRNGLGSLSRLDDEAMLCVLEFLDAKSLCLFGAASRITYAFAAHDDTWRALVLRVDNWDFVFHGSWRATATGQAAPFPPPFSRCGLYSAVLYHAHRAATARIRKVWGEFDNLPRLSLLNTEEENFRINFEMGVGRPSLFVGGVKDRWPGWEANGGGEWSGPSLVAKHGTACFHAGGFDPSLSAYTSYASRDTSDQAMYIFDAEFVNKVPILGNYKVPDLFSNDLFALLPPLERPHFQWLICGPRKSGSVFHVDPNGTSAWNACLAGAKLWILLPPDLPPPGVWASQDGAHACAPLSVVEWYLQFWEPYREMRDKRLRACDAEDAAKVKIAAAAATIGGEVEGGGREGGGSLQWHASGGGGQKRGRPSSTTTATTAPPPPPLARPYSGIAREGDIVFIPHGWWHCVLNIGEGLTIAVTQNFCSKEGLPKVLQFLREKPHAISGMRDDDSALQLERRFRSVLQEKEPEELLRADAILAAAIFKQTTTSSSSRWARVTAAAAATVDDNTPFSATSLWGGGKEV